MTTMSILILATAAGGALYVSVKAIRAFAKLRGPRLVTCPETGQPVAVTVDTAHAALTGVAHAPDLRLSTCSRWPERRGCGQECLRQIEGAPEDCLVRTILARWYEGKSCALCGRSFGVIHPGLDKPGLLAADGATREWTTIPVERLPQMLATHEPVCWNCQIANEFRQSHPDLIIDVPPRERRA